jgi:hypothetical protein
LFQFRPANYVAGPGDDTLRSAGLNAIENPGAHEAEQDIRRSAKVLREVADPTPLIPRIIDEIKQIAGRRRDVEIDTGQAAACPFLSVFEILRMWTIP